jgi:HTH-type transcriptional regulator/antitoxin HigA
MEARGLTRKDLEPYIGPRGRVSDILNRIRPLSLEMIRRLSAGLKLPAEVLIRPYHLRHEAEELAAA